MRNRILLLSAVLALSAATASALSFEAGATGAGGLSFAYGTYMEDWDAAVSELGASSLDSAGATTAQLFPELSAGIYGEVRIIDQLGVRLEPRWALLGGAHLAVSDADVTYERYGLYFSSILVPLMARGYLALGPGELVATAGPFLGIVAGSVTIVQRYDDATTSMSLDAGGTFFGMSGGFGYAMDMGPGRASLELRADWAFSPIANKALGGTLYAVGTTLTASYGIPIGGDWK